MTAVVWLAGGGLFTAVVVIGAVIAGHFIGRNRVPKREETDELPPTWRPPAGR